MNDFALTLRAMAARPGFFAACIVTLALGVGSVSAIFSVVQEPRRSCRCLRRPSPARTSAASKARRSALEKLCGLA